MLDILEDFLRVSATPEFYSAVQKATALFEDFELTEWDTAYTDLLMTLDNEDLGDDIDKIRMLTLELQNNILRNVQIALSEDATVSQMNLVLESLRMIERAENAKELLCVVQDNEDPKDAFCEILAVLWGDCGDNYQPLVHQVSGEFINRMSTVLRQESSFQEPTPLPVEEDRKYAQRIKSFMHACECEGLLVVNHIRSGARFGLPFAHYFKLFREYLNPSRHTEVAREVLAMALCSSEWEKPREAVVEQLNKHYTDAEVVTRVMMALDDWLVTWHNYENAGVRKDRE